MTPWDPECPALLRAFTLRNNRALLPEPAASANPVFRKAGTSFEVRNLREFAPGDDPRRIDWKLTARSGRTFIKEFFEEEHERILVAVDCSASMKTFDRRVFNTVASSLLFLLSGIGFSVKLVSFAESLVATAPQARDRHGLKRLISFVEGMRFGGKSDIARSIGEACLRYPHGKIVIISDFLDPSFTVPSGSKRIMMIRIKTPFPGRLSSDGLFELIDPESGKSALVPWNPVTRNEYENAERTLHDTLSEKRSNTRFFELTRETPRKKFYGEFLEALLG